MLQHVHSPELAAEPALPVDVVVIPVRRVARLAHASARAGRPADAVDEPLDGAKVA
jgi:hypothetical protein